MSLITSEEIEYLENDFLDELELNPDLIIRATRIPNPSPAVKSFMENMISLNKKSPLAAKTYQDALQNFLSSESQMKKNALPENSIPLIPQNIAPNLRKKEIQVLDSNLLCKIEYEKINLEELKPLLLEFVDSYTNITLESPFEEEIYTINNEINVHDELGEWRFDPFQNVIKISFYLKDKTILTRFPKVFSIAKNYFSKSKNVEYKPKQEDHNKRSLDVSCSLSEFLDEVITANFKNKSFKAKWQAKLSDQYIERVDELLGWENEEWDKCNLEPNVKKLIRKELNRFRFPPGENDKKDKWSESQVLSITHRIKRFLLYKVNPEQLKNIPDLDPTALKSGFKEIRDEYVGETLLNELETFYKSFSVARSYSKNIILSRGNLLYGPPGTGKTILTDTLPGKIGLTPISFPLCAAEVNRSLVGQTEKLLMDLFSRANRIPYLLCCISIDEIDGLTPKRDEKSSQSKTDALAILLSMIGGIKDVKNLLIIASTNRLNQMDDAFKRRMSGQYFVGRPSPSARKIIIERSERTNLDEEMIKQTVMLTSNFSGAALKQLISYIIIKSKEIGWPLTYEEIAMIASQTSKQFNIRLGSYSLPDIFLSHRKRENFFTKRFFEGMKQNLGFITFDKQYIYFHYLRSRKVSWTKDNQMEIDKKLIMADQPITTFLDLVHWLKKNTKNMNSSLFNMGSITHHEFRQDNPNFRDLENIISKLPQEKGFFKKKESVNNLLLWDDFLSYFNQSKILNSDDKTKLRNLLKKVLISDSFHFFVAKDEELYKSFFDWKKYTRLDRDNLNYTGRIMIDLSDDDQEMRFELDEEEDNYELFCESLYMDSRISKSSLVVPNLVEFASKRGIDYILLMDLDFLMANSAYDDAKVQENINEKMSEFNSYDKAMLIIDVDSMVGISKSSSTSSMGLSTSNNISDTKIYKMIVHYANNYARRSHDTEYWVALIVNNKEISRFLLEDIHFRKTEACLLNEEKERIEKTEQKKCIRCYKSYTEDKNEIESCIYHDGPLIKISSHPSTWTLLSITEARVDSIKAQSQQSLQNPNEKTLNQEPKYMHLCCENFMGSQGCRNNKHTIDTNLFEAEKICDNERSDKKAR